MQQLSRRFKISDHERHLARRRVLANYLVRDGRNGWTARCYKLPLPRERGTGIRVVHSLNTPIIALPGLQAVERKSSDRPGISATNDFAITRRKRKRVYDITLTGRRSNPHVISQPARLLRITCSLP